ncbi:MAG TPA: SDR family oxidoreductase, partial [Solirubrobacteraceae bacterium]|jgi:dTDP-4-dehydrorhamnose reductase
VTVLVTGASGLLGAAVLAAPPSATGAVGWSSADVDVRDGDAVRRAFGDLGPSCCVHCAAIASATRCEDDPALAWAVNAQGTAHVARACAEHGTRLVHISTDWVFDGTRPDGVGEDAPTAPLQVYGRTKLAAEGLALRVPGALVVRVPLLYGAGSGHRPTWPQEVAERLTRGERCSADAREVRYPTLAGDVARTLVALVERGASGVVHVAPREGITKHAWALLLARRLGLDESLVEPGAPVAGGPPRPRHARLLTPVLDRLAIPPPHGVREALGRVAAALGEAAVRT